MNENNPKFEETKEKDNKLENSIVPSFNSILEKMDDYTFFEMYKTKNRKGVKKC